MCCWCLKLVESLRKSFWLAGFIQTGPLDCFKFQNQGNTSWFNVAVLQGSVFDALDD